MSKPQKQTVYIGIIALVFFLILSLMTKQWGFFLVCIPIVLMVFSAVMTNKHFKKTNEAKDN